MTPAAPVVAHPSMPFRGLEPLRYVDRPIFTGRERETELLRRLVVIYRAVLLYGDSGTGKSSLLNAGLIPAAEEEGLRPERIRVQPRGGEELVVERIAREDGPAQYLPSVLVNDDQPSAVFSVPAFRRRLEEVKGGPPPLLIFDQFEELVTLFQEAPSEDGSLHRRRLQDGVVDLLHELLEDASLSVKVLFAFREDYLAKILDIFTAHPHLKDQYVRLAPPSEEALRTIARGPFERFPGLFAPELSPSLAARLVKAIVAHADRGSSSLSELQVACLRLWRSPEPESVFAERGLQGLLEDELSAAIERLDESTRYAAVALLGQLVTASGARNVVSEEDLISRTEIDAAIPAARLRSALAALERDTRLVRREVRHNVVFYEIVSEFLLPWIARHRQRAEISREVEGRAPERLEDAIAWYERRSSGVRAQQLQLQLVEIVGLATVPVLAATRVSLTIIGAVAVAALVLDIVRHLLPGGDRWRAYAVTAAELRREKYLFLTGAAPYAHVAQPQRLLSERVEAVLAEDPAVGRSALSRPIATPTAPPAVAESPAWQRSSAALSWYARMSRQASMGERLLTTLRILGLAAIVVLCLLPAARSVIGAVGVVVAIVASVQQLIRFEDQSSAYRRTAEALAHELSLFLSLAGPYRGLPDIGDYAQRMLIERAERLLTPEVVELPMDMMARPKDPVEHSL
jgi:hypothetical protein